MRYGKLENGVLKYAPSKIKLPNGFWAINPTAEQYEEAGYYKVIESEKPPLGEKQHYEISYEQKADCILIVYTAVDQSPAEECADLRSWFDNDYRKYNEMLTRFEALGITKVIYDAIRDKEYTTLIDLYNEAEVVRARINELENELAVL